MSADTIPERLLALADEAYNLDREAWRDAHTLLDMYMRGALEENQLNSGWRDVIRRVEEAKKGAR